MSFSPIENRSDDLISQERSRCRTLAAKTAVGSLCFKRDRRELIDLTHTHLQLRRTLIG
jgi:hypothetical protein